MLNNHFLMKRKKLALGFGFIIVFIFMFFVLDYHDRTLYQTCFYYYGQSSPNENLNLLEDIVEADVKPRDGKNIFFHETSCANEDRILNLNARQACAVESAARMNPHMNVFVLFASKVGLASGELAKFPNNSKTVSPIIKALQSYKNINFNFINLTTYAKNTPLKDFVKSGKIEKSKYFNSHLSDVLRYLSLWKYGGTYLDLDVIVLKPLDSIPPNYAGAESDNFVAAGIINVEHDKFGHQFADMCVRDLKLNFDGSDWGSNGPGVITRVLQNICGTKKTTKMTKVNCYDFNVLPVKTCYAILWPEHKHFFKEQYLEETMKRVNESLIVHVWNKHSEHSILSVDSKVAYIELAKKFCPKTIQSCGKHF